MTDESQWDCEAYGPEGREAGALCFFAPELGDRVCVTAAECSGRMVVERARVFDVIREGAAAGDPTMKVLAAEFTEPFQLLGGAGSILFDPAEPDPDATEPPVRHDPGAP